MPHVRGGFLPKQKQDGPQKQSVRAKLRETYESCNGGGPACRI